LISTGVNKVVRPTMNSIVNMLLQHCSTVTTWNNMIDNLFIVGRTTLFTPLDINLEQPMCVFSRVVNVMYILYIIVWKGFLQTAWYY
jgi:hypothetical protein